MQSVGLRKRERCHVGGVVPCSSKRRGKDGSTLRAAVFQLHNNKTTGDVTLARRTYGKHVLLERWQEPIWKWGDGWRFDGNKDKWRTRPGWCQVYLPSVETLFSLYLLHSSIISTSTELIWSPFPSNCWKILIKLCIDLAHCHFFSQNGNSIIIWGLCLVKTQLRQIKVISLGATMSLILNKCCFLPMITTP